MRREIADLRAALGQCQRDRREDKEQAASQHQVDRREIARLQDALRAWESRWANTHRIDVPAPRDLRPADDRPTVPIDVSSVRAVFRVIPITERPDAANPANIPAA
jgi:phage protein D